ncbi:MULTISPECIES: ATP-dependent DNA helicase [Salinibaculum]|uniref:ATP-dependent DNA helicase n=1 Tax=Salinibaculum TaxID=2732368 RepID=UPI0030CB7F8E
MADSEVTDRWRDFFGFEEPYDNQADAVESAIQVGRANGYLAMEGPCGTGKTMAALTAGATLVREGDYERIVVVTPVKQQLQQFVDDLRTMNTGLEEPLRGISLVGKRDLCPYGREGAFPEDASTHDRCEDLRENTARLVESDRKSDDRAVASTAVGGESEEIWWDPQRGSDLAKHARPDGPGQQTFEDALATAGATSPYRTSQPSAPETMVEGDDTPLYCPFEADWYARNKGSPVDFGVGENHVVTAEDYLPAATERGTCPHRVMGVLLEEADVVVGNYNHLFDPDSRPLLESILDERTFVVVDEAHRLEERVRDLLSDRVGRATLKRARNDCQALLSRARQTSEHKQQVADRLASHDVPIEAVERAREFYDDALTWLDERVADHLTREYGPEWRGGNTGDLPDRTVEVPLRDPETVEQDELTAWAEREGYTGDLWRSLPAVGAAVEDTIDDLGLTRTPVCAAVGVIAKRWWEKDHASYLREIELEYSPADERSADRPWQTQYTAGLVLFECMPGDTLKDVFAGLGGGILMSATLEPLDVFGEVAGLEALRRADRPVVERTYTLPFPEENRASWLVDATPFTAHNRGDPAENADQKTWTATRDEYAHVLRTLARSPGNVLVAMPNYREAAWAGEYLRDAVEKPVLVDESSSNDETEALKREFFAGDGKVLVTSTRGTLTEGVDYDGDKLHCAAVVGVPLVNIGSPRVRAVRRAYADAFGEDSAFEYALTVPAVRRARQTIGRVIRGHEEVGTRALVGRRYTAGARHSVHGYLSPGEREEFVRLTPEFLSDQQDRFWADQPSPE